MGSTPTNGRADVLKSYLRRFLFTSSLFLTACGGGSSTPVATPTPTPAPGPNATPQTVTTFADRTDGSGVSFVTGFAGDMANIEIPIILPSGVAAADYDADGDVDVFIVRGDTGPNLLYVNQGNLVFEDAAADAGIAFTKSAQENYRHSSPAFADMDGDGDLDLLLPGLDGDPTKIYANAGDGTFEDVTTGSGLDLMQAAYSMSPAFGDYDLDGDLDLALAHWGTLRDETNPGDTEHLWRNDSGPVGIQFTSVSVEAAISPSIITNEDPFIASRSFDHTFTPTFARINDDAYPDLLMVGDFNFSQVFINNQDGTFTNATDFAVIRDGNGMGSAVGDYDGDGDLDWFVSSILARGEQVPANLSTIGNRLYRNDDGVFSDATEEANVASGGWGWGSCFLDIENDGDLDIYQTNGWPDWAEFGSFPTDQTRVFESNGDGTFVDSAIPLGLNDTQQGRGIVCADFDNDGDVDVLQLHLDTTLAATLWVNTLNTNNYLKVKLLGAAPNTEAVGARIYATSGGEEQMREVNLGSNFASHNPTVQHFGLGASTQVDTLRIVWPDGSETVQQSVSANQEVIIAQPGS